MNTDWKKYIIAFLITAIIFVTAIMLSNYYGNKRINEVKSIQDSISLDILSSETQFQLLEETSCKTVDNSYLSQELGSLGDKLSYAEDHDIAGTKEIQDLKQYYSLLLIKDYLLVQRASEKCDFNPVFVLYFYSNTGDCPECTREGHVLTDLRKEYPQLRIYAFDYDLDLAALSTLKSIFNVGKDLPALVIDGKLYYGYKSIKDIENIIPTINSLKATTTEQTSTSTASTTTS